MVALQLLYCAFRVVTRLIARVSHDRPVDRDRPFSYLYNKVWRGLYSLLRLSKIKAVEVRSLGTVCFLRFCAIHVARRRSSGFEQIGERVIRCPFIASPLRMLATRVLRDDFFRRGWWGGSFCRLQRWLLSACSTWLIAGVTLAPLTFGIEWQLDSPPGCCRA